MTPFRICFLLAITMVFSQAAEAQLPVRIKDLTTVEGFRTNRLEGYGLVAGLAGTGGKSPLTRQALQNFMIRNGIRADSQQRLNIVNDTRQKTDNVAVVAVTAEVPAFARPGSAVDVTVACIDDASSLQGGQLLPTVLFGIDGKPYGMAAGNVSVGGFSFGGDAATVQKNHPTLGRIPAGLTLEEPIAMRVADRGLLRLILRAPDFATASRIERAINRRFPLTARAADPATVELVMPGDRLANVSRFISEIGELRVQPDARARVIINERTGTVIAGHNVRIGRVALTHANLAIVTTETPQVSQPAPFSDGQTTTVPRSDVSVTEEANPITVIDGTATVGELATALNALGVAPRDLSSIFQTLRSAGALHADIHMN